MELVDRMYRIGSVRKLSARVRLLSERLGRSPARAALGRHQKRILGIAFLAGSAVSAIWAHDLAQAEALSAWLKAHPPSAQIWKHALLSRGFRSLDRNSTQLQKASKTLPALIDDEGTLWLSADSNWVAFFGKASEDPAPNLFCLHCEKAPAGWGPMGKGWEAFDPALARVDEVLERDRANAPAPKPRAELRDPREIRY